MDKIEGPSEKVRALLYSIGFAITQWQYVEGALTELFAALVQGNRGATSAAFNTVLSTRVRLLMIQASASIRLNNSPLLDECISLCKRMDKKANKRNELAHFMMFQDAVLLEHPIDPKDYETAFGKIDFYLSPTFLDAARDWRFQGSVPVVRANDAMNRARAFIEAAEQIRQFTQKVIAALAPPPTLP